MTLRYMSEKEIKTTKDETCFESLSDVEEASEKCLETRTSARYNLFKAIAVLKASKFNIIPSLQMSKFLFNYFALSKAIRVSRVHVVTQSERNGR